MIRRPRLILQNNFQTLSAKNLLSCFSGTESYALRLGSSKKIKNEHSVQFNQIQFNNKTITNMGSYFPVFSVFSRCYWSSECRGLAPHGPLQFLSLYFGQPGMSQKHLECLRKFTKSCDLKDFFYISYFSILFSFFLTDQNISQHFELIFASVLSMFEVFD